MVREVFQEKQFCSNCSWINCLELHAEEASAFSWEEHWISWRALAGAAAILHWGVWLQGVRDQHPAEEAVNHVWEAVDVQVHCNRRYPSAELSFYSQGGRNSVAGEAVLFTQDLYVRKLGSVLKGNCLRVLQLTKLMRLITLNKCQWIVLLTVLWLVTVLKLSALFWYNLLCESI